MFLLNCRGEGGGEPTTLTTDEEMVNVENRRK